MFFDSHISSRITAEDYKRLVKIVLANQDKYENESHFIRVAVIKLIREEET